MGERNAKRGRSASTSMARSEHLPIDLILKARGWRSMKSYVKHCDKPIEENKFAEAILQSGNVIRNKIVIRVAFNSISEYYNTNVFVFPRVCTLNELEF